LLNIPTKSDLINNPKLGASWEGFALELVIRHHKAYPEEIYFWGIHNHAELDLLIIKNGKRYGFEFKYAEAPKVTSSMKLAIEFLKLDSLTVIYPGNKNYQLGETVTVCGLQEYLKRNID
jgi:predicted AAA+ superfamily ATPase